MSGARTALLAVLLAATLASTSGTRAAENPAAELESGEIEVVGTTPVPGLGVGLTKVPSSVQGASANDLRRQDALDATEYLERNFAGVNVNGAANNPYMPDLQYRGFTASPLLGLPQGLSVFVDGVRVNEAFGDVVNWDLIPRNAIASSTLLAGSNPVFGLNTLGGALSMQTKSGFAFPGQSARLQAGSWGRRSLEAEAGGSRGRSDYFVAANAFDEQGWRDHSPSRVRQLFVKTGREDAQSDFDLSLALAQNSLQGVQALPLSMLGNPRQGYTWPDRTDNDLAMITLRASRFVGDDRLVAGNLYLRDLDQDNFNSNVNDAFNPALPSGVGNSQAFNDRYALKQRMLGAALQVTQDAKLAEGNNRLTLGASVDRGEVRFGQDRQEAGFSADRGTTDIVYGGFTQVLRMRASNTYYGIYASEQYSPSERWTWTASGRYNLARVSLRDESGGALNGDHRFHRFNPGLGAAWNPSASSTWYASYSEGMRAPSPVELTCADPAAPCSLPNAFLADPPLKPVIARTLEIGTRIDPGRDTRLTAAVYRSVLNDDIQFVTSGGAINAGFFQNIGRTRREGLELGGRTAVGALALRAGLSFTRAVYVTPFTINSPNNSSADPASGDIDVRPGDRIPGIPARSLKLRGDWTVSERASLGLGWNWFDRQYARGDENNRDVHGALPAYSVANLVFKYELGEGWEVSAKADNLFNRSYQSFGILGENFFTGPNNGYNPLAPAAEQFRSPGAPRAVWLGVRYEAKGERR
jgi:outer membrane receptor protein involved in Fe transport